MITMTQMDGLKVVVDESEIRRVNHAGDPKSWNGVRAHVWTTSGGFHEVRETVEEIEAQLMGKGDEA